MCVLEREVSSGRMIMRIQARATERYLGEIVLFPTHYEFMCFPHQAISERDIFAHLRGHSSMPFHDIFRVLDPEYAVRHTLAAKKALDCEEAAYVDQREYAIACAGSEITKLKTFWLHTCHGLSLYDPVTRVGALAHFDMQTKFFDSFRKMTDDLRKEHGVPPEDLTATLIKNGTYGSNKVLINLTIQLEALGIREAGMIIAPDDDCHAMLDVEAGEVSLIDRVEFGPEHLKCMRIGVFAPLGRPSWNMRTVPISVPS